MLVTQDPDQTCRTGNVFGGPVFAPHEVAIAITRRYYRPAL
jgi:hypothetical protein